MRAKDKDVSFYKLKRTKILNANMHFILKYDLSSMRGWQALKWHINRLCQLMDEFHNTLTQITYYLVIKM